MSDMLVKLYQLPDNNIVEKLQQNNIVIRKGLAPEKQFVCQWIEQHFGAHWASEAAVAFCRQPSSILLAQEGKTLLGFACYDATSKGFFGPTGVDEKHRGKGLGEALLVQTLQEMQHDGYAYAVIGSAGPVKFYQDKVGAIEIADSSPGIYRHLLV